MKSEGQLRHKIKQVTFRHLKRALEDGLSVRPCNCKFNMQLQGGGSPLAFCGLSGTDTGTYTVCDEKFKGREKAQNCQLFQLRRSKDEIRSEFDTRLRTKEIHTLAADYPDLVALLWVLDTDMTVPQEPPVEYRFVPMQPGTPASYAFQPFRPISCPGGIHVTL